jgi:hypothetical protein
MERSGLGNSLPLCVVRLFIPLNSSSHIREQEPAVSARPVDWRSRSSARQRSLEQAVTTDSLGSVKFSIEARLSSKDGRRVCVPVVSSDHLPLAPLSPSKRLWFCIHLQGFQQFGKSAFRSKATQDGSTRGVLSSFCHRGDATSTAKCTALFESVRRPYILLSQSK